MNNDRILIVDDDRVVLELTTLLLRNHGYDVLKASEGETALKLVKEQAPALVLMDYMMPGMDGLQVLRKIKLYFPETYVIMFTGQGSEELAVELMKAGAADYLLKPYRNHILLERVENALRMRRVELHNRDLLQEREHLLNEIEAWNRELEWRVEEKTRELELAQAEIIQVEKLAALGHLTAGMAHEIRNPLNAISLFAQILKNIIPADPDPLDCLDKIQSEVERIDAFLVKLLAASRPSSRALQPVQLDAVVRETLEQFAPQIAAQSVALQIECADVPAMLGDGGELRQVFTNLFANALHEMPYGGRLGVRLQAVDGEVLIDVADTGKGIPREHFNRIFDPFFTTKTKGTGFGLSVVLRIVKSYRGKIAVESDPQTGTVFHLRFPLDVTAPAVAESPAG